MPTLITKQFPALRIFDPISGEYRQFVGGRLDIEADDPAFAAVMAEASRNPAIYVVTTEVHCPECGEGFEGKMAKARMTLHRKDAHYDAWLADDEAKHVEERHVEMKSRAGVACDVCRPAQVFGSEDELAAHVRILHTAAPALDAEGNTIGQDREESAPAAPADVPPARRRRPGEVEPS